MASSHQQCASIRFLNAFQPRITFGIPFSNCNEFTLSPPKMWPRQKESNTGMSLQTEFCHLNARTRIVKYCLSVRFEEPGAKDPEQEKT
ncbi:MAG TPA: hypothetical protein DDZ24_08845 [Planctomycetaceae bacterium]|nr:hypothetical protein [Planctomycetaceae bacterium]